MFQSEIMPTKCCKEIIIHLELVFFSNFPWLSRNNFVCKFVYIVHTDQNTSGR